MASSETRSLEEELKEVLADENTSAILTSLRLFAPLNLKGIAELLGKAESTLHRHMNKLRERNLIVAADDVELPGKYYRTHQDVIEFYKQRIETSIDEFETKVPKFQNLLQEANSEDEKVRLKARQELLDDVKEDFEHINANAKAIEASFNITKNIQTVILQQFLQVINNKEVSIDNVDQFLTDPQNIGALNHINTTIEITHDEDMLRIIEAIIEFIQTIDNLSKDVEKKMTENPDLKATKVYLSLFSGAIRENDSNNIDS